MFPTKKQQEKFERRKADMTPEERVGLVRIGSIAAGQGDLPQEIKDRLLEGYRQDRQAVAVDPDAIPNTDPISPDGQTPSAEGLQ